MHSSQEKLADSNQEIQNNELSTLRKRWISYLDIPLDQIKISSDHQKRLSMTSLFHQYAVENKKLFHLTVTYKSYRNTQYSAKITNDFFINFYLKSFLPSLLGTRNFNKDSKRSLQPICYAFLDEHKQKLVPVGEKNEFPDRLHHHAILAVPPDTVACLSSMLGENAIPLRTRYASKVMTTHIRECEAMTLLYASKKLQKYPEFLTFPDRIARV